MRYSAYTMGFLAGLIKAATPAPPSQSIGAAGAMQPVVPEALRPTGVPAKLKRGFSAINAQPSPVA